MSNSIWLILINNDCPYPELYAELSDEVERLVKESYRAGYDQGVYDIQRLDTDYDQG